MGSAHTQFHYLQTSTDDPVTWVNSCDHSVGKVHIFVHLVSVEIGSNIAHRGLVASQSTADDGQGDPAPRPPSHESWVQPSFAPYSFRMATARTGDAVVLTHLIGKRLSLNPNGGSKSRLFKFSR